MFRKIGDLTMIGNEVWQIVCLGSSAVFNDVQPPHKRPPLMPHDAAPERQGLCLFFRPEKCSLLAKFKKKNQRGSP
jgi:hypothetical protein